MADMVADVHGAVDLATHVRVWRDGVRLLTAPLRGGRWLVGRSDGCDLALPSDTVSRVHCALVRRADGWYLDDRSRHGTPVDGVVGHAGPLRVGARLAIGAFEVELIRPSGEEPTTRTRAMTSADHEVPVDPARGVSLRAVLDGVEGPCAGQRFVLDGARCTVGGLGADRVVDPVLPPDAVILRVSRARVIVEPGSRPCRLGGDRVRVPTPAWDGEILRVGHAALRVGVVARTAEGDTPSGDGLIGDSGSMQRLRRALAQVARHHAPVLLLGETGTGKELAAQAVHALGPRADGPFVAINAGALPEALVESELFGHEAGAFTGAGARADGAFHRAEGGTLFLDEVGELPPSAQAALLRVLETGEVRRVGGAVVSCPDVRVVAATHRDLEAMVREGTFREDLLHRLAVLPLGVPPLRDRLDDLPALVDALLVRDHPGAAITPEAREVLRGHGWPGNVRELRNVLTRAVVLGGPRIEATSLSFHPGAFDAVRRVQSTPDPDAMERRRLEEALRQAGGSKAEAARLLDIPRTSLIYRLTKHGMA